MTGDHFVLWSLVRIRVSQGHRMNSITAARPSGRKVLDASTIGS